MSNCRTINDLPDEILVEIFSFLRVQDVVYSVENVCHRWKEVVQDRRLWRHLIYRPNSIFSYYEVYNVFRRAPHLRWFVPPLRYTSGSILLAVILGCKNIRELELSIDSTECLMIERLVNECPHIEKLSLLDNDFAETRALSVVSKCLKLKSLRLIGQVSQVNRNVFLELSNGCPSLVCLDLRYLTRYNLDDLEYLLRKKRDTITSLFLYCCIEGQNCSLPIVFRHCPNLELLHANGHVGEPFTEDFTSLKNLVRLKTLCMTDFKCYNLHHVMKYFETCFVPKLVKLDFRSFEGFGKKLAILIFEKCTSLKHLNLGDCKELTDECLEPISNLNQLLYLNVDGCNEITDGGVEYIVKCRYLKHLMMNNCKRITTKSLALCCEKLKMLHELQMNTCKVNPLDLLRVPWDLAYLKVLNVDLKGVKETIILSIKGRMPKLDLATDIPIEEVHFSE